MASSAPLFAMFHRQLTRRAGSPRDHARAYSFPTICFLGRRQSMTDRRQFMRGALGALAFTTVGGAQVMLTPREAKAQGVPFRLLDAREAETIEAMGEALVPGARGAGISHFIDHQLSVPP